MNTEIGTNGITGEPQEKPGWIQEFEDAKLETPSEQMDRIIQAENKFKTIDVLLTILAKEVGLDIGAKMEDIFLECGKAYQAYSKAMEEFKRISRESIKLEGLKKGYKHSPEPGKFTD